MQKKLHLHRTALSTVHGRRRGDSTRQLCRVGVGVCIVHYIPTTVTNARKYKLYLRALVTVVGLKLAYLNCLSKRELENT